MTRSPESIGRLAVQVKVIKADVSNYADLRKALAGIDVTFYLIHSMGSSKDWKKFVERDRNAAENFGVLPNVGLKESFILVACITKRISKDYPIICVVETK